MLRSRLGLLFKVLSVGDGGCEKSCYMYDGSRTEKGGAQPSRMGRA